MKLISIQQYEAVSGGNYLIMVTTLTGLAGGLGIGGELAWCLDRSVSGLCLPLVTGTFGGVSGALLGTGMVGIYHVGAYFAVDILGLV